MDPSNIETPWIYIDKELTILNCDMFSSSFLQSTIFAQSAGAVEYTDCTSAEG